MKDFSTTTKFYLFSIWILGAVLFLWNIPNIRWQEWPVLLVMIVVASVAIIIRVIGITIRWHFDVNFVPYGFSLFHMDIGSTMLMIIVSNLVFWLWYQKEFKTKWYIILFNASCYIFVAQLTKLIFDWINPKGDLSTLSGVVGLFVSLLAFTLVNHLLVGIIVWLTSGENFIQSGVFEFMPLIIDITLLIIGGSLNIVWNYNPFAILLFLFPLYMIYNTLRVPGLERQTELDPKTSLFNHKYFIQQLENELTRANRFNRPLTVILADLDLLRNINNTYGHLAGDEVIIGVAHIMKAMVREYDIVSRFGGEEFAILMPETDSDTAFLRAEEIRIAIQSAEFTVPTSVTPIKATMSFGIASRENIKQTKEEIIHNADIVLYYSKLKGRNRTHIYTPEDFQDEEFTKSFPTAKTGSEEVGGSYQVAEGKFQNVSPKQDAPQEPATSPSEPADAVTDSNPPDEPSATKPAPSNPPIAQPSVKRRSTLAEGFIILVTLTAGLLFGLHYPTYHTGSWAGLILFVSLLALTEWLSIDLYIRDTAISTSAAPMLAGAILFGPVGALVLSITFGLTAYIKFRGPLNRILFNASNQLLVAMMYLWVVRWSPVSFSEWHTGVQLIYTVIAMSFTFLVTTILVSIGMSLSSGESAKRIWKEQFRWLGPYYLIMGLIAYSLIFGYATASWVGVVLVIAPLLILRYSQTLYIERTRKIVVELREKNTRLENNARDISAINNGLLDTLAEVIDLRDKYVLSHSQRVTHFAVLIAQHLALNPRQTEVVRKASLLHDIGKLGISENILGKPARLTPEEYQEIQKHPVLGAALLENSPSLRNLIPAVKHHHESFDGKGYPFQLKGEQIPIEARIVAVADAIEAMSSHRPYHQVRKTEAIIAELERCAGTQFDPQVVEVAIKILKEQMAS
jgi:diguanylate cyclase (GGDEF)-like protein/putative nucleotidyltransferase with HDIG domain